MKIIFLLFFILLLSSCSSKPYVVKQIEETFTAEHVTIYVVSHGWHTGIVVPARKIQSILPPLRERFGNTPYIEFGWGDNMFYPADEITTGLTLRAILWPTESVIHAVAIPEKIAIYFSNSQIEKLCLSGPEYSLLISFISESFHKNQKDDIVQLKNGIYGNSQFYQGEGTFHFMNTCNNWTAKALKSAGMDISPGCTLTASNVMDSIAEYNQTLKITATGEADSAVPCR